MSGYKYEHRNSISMVYVGSSAVYRSWSPLLAWSEYDITSYALAGRIIPPSVIKNWIIEAQKTQNPDLFVVDVYSFMKRETSWTYTEEELAAYADALNYSINRHNMIKTYSKYELDTTSVKDTIRYDFDILRYYKRFDEIDEKSFEYILNRKKENYKGFQLLSSSGKRIPPHKAYEKPVWNFEQITKNTNLTSDGKAMLIELLDYCKEKDLNVLFINSPFQSMDKENKEVLNSIEKIIEDYDYDFIDQNEYYDEIGFNFGKDFYNSEHVNIFGTEKYTRYFANYLVENYDLKTDRNEFKYTKEWDNDYEIYRDDIVNYKKEVEAYIKKKEK